MNSLAYNAMKTEMEKGNYTEVEARETLTTMYAQKMLSSEEYSELMELAGTLNANTSDGEWRNMFTALEERVKANETNIQLIKEKLSEGGTEVPEPEEGATGSENDPIDTYRGMTYYKDKYYRDSEDGQVYQCYRDSDSEPGTGIRLDYLPHELVNIYFYFVRVS